VKHPQAHIPAVLAQLPLFQELDGELLERLARAARERCYVRGEIVFRVGERPTGLFVVTAGLVKEACMSLDGKEKILELIDAPRIFGESALFLDSPFPYYAAALVDTRLLHIDRAIFLELAFSQPTLVQRLLRMLSGRVLTLVRDVESFATHRHVQRVACYLISRCGDSVATDASIVLPASKQVIASRLGMTPETFSRNLRDLVDAGLIVVRGDRISVPDLAQLKAFAV
jgi:CRP/FNR family transcriptional regulator, dissimilatory nitrate respiration regulator